MQSYRNARIILAILLILSFTAAGCGPKEESGRFTAGMPAAGANKSVQIKIGIDNYRGDYYLVGSAITAVINKTSRIINIRTFPGEIPEQIDNLAAGELDLAFISTAYVQDILSDPANAGYEKLKRLKIVTPLYSKVLQCVVKKNGSIKKISDLRGKRIAEGLSGYEAKHLTRLVLGFHGLAYEDFSSLYTEPDLISEFKKGNIDCIIFNARIPFPAISDLSANMNIELLHVDKTFINDTGNWARYYSIKTIYPKTYQGVSEYVLTASTPVLLVARDSLEEESVYNITKAIYENISELESFYPLDKKIGTSTDNTPLPMPLHPGAYRFFSESQVIR